MKTIYVKPTVKILDLETEQLLAAVSYTGESANPGEENLSKENGNVINGYKYDIWGLDDDDDR